MTRLVLAAAFATASLLAAAGCGDSGPTVVEGFQVLKVIDLKETDYALDPSAIQIDRFGYYGIKVVNDGSVEHALKLEGAGVDRTTASIPAGESVTIAVFFKTAGVVKMLCPLGDHAAKGMTGTIKVH